MIPRFVERFEAGRDELRERIRGILDEKPVEGQRYAGPPVGAGPACVLTVTDDVPYFWLNYDQLVFMLVEILAAGDEYEEPDPERITRIDFGGYQGTLVYVIAGTGYQPGAYWTMTVGYGSCSGCDTLQRLQEEYGYKDGDKALEGFLTLALHLVQRTKPIGMPWD